MLRSLGVDLYPAALVDAFTDSPFRGNRAGLVLLDADGTQPDPAWMHAVAQEIGASETGFLVPEGPCRYGLRWFSPAIEMDLCGHATLAAAHWLWERGESADVFRFETRAGTLSAVHGEERLIWLDFPVVPVVDENEPAGWREAFPGASLKWVGRTGGAHDLERYTLFVTDAETLRSLAPDFERVAALPCAGAVVTALSDSTDADVLTRYFAPSCGVNEDPATGSVHCTVGWYWAPILAKTRLRARQVSARGGDLRIEMKGDRVRLGGCAVTVARLDLVV